MFQKATFIKRLNRFTVVCQINGQKTQAYLPNPGRLWEILIPGKTVYLKKQEKGLPFILWAAERQGQIMCLDTHYTNEVAKALIEKGCIKDLEGYFIRDKEYRIDGHRIDFLLSNGFHDLILEVKSCTLFQDQIAMFPDAVTSRGKKHLEILGKRNGAIVFIVHNPQVRYFLPDFHTDPDFSQTLSKFRDTLLIKPVSIRWKEDMTFEFVDELFIPWYIYDGESSDKGSYMLCGKLEDEKTLQVGKLGMLTFRPGYYLYVGSAMNSLSARIKRHMRVRKSLKWHIDYIAPHFKDFIAIPVRSSEPLECSLSKAVDSIADGYIPNFGCSDCNCDSHLYWFAENPFKSEEFVDVILGFRIGRLKKFLKPNDRVGIS